MPDFVATYKLSGPPPRGWEEQLEKFAADKGLVAEPSSMGDEAYVLCKVPESSPEIAGAIAKAFFEEAAATLPGVRLVRSHPVLKHKFRPVTFAKALVGALAALLAISLFALPYLLAERFVGHSTALVAAGVSGLACVLGLARLIYEIVVGGDEPDSDGETQQQAAAARLAREIAKDEDPKQTMRIEAARISLRMRAGRMRSDADDLRDRSVWAYRGALFFYLLSIAGPGTAATLLLNSGTLDWHLMFGGFGLAAVPLTIGTALLRHDTKLREQYEKAATNVATLERYELALDYARIGAQPSYDVTLQQVITQLLTLPPATPGAAAAAPAGNQDGGEAAATAVATKLLETATSILGQKK